MHTLTKEGRLRSIAKEITLAAAIASASSEEERQPDFFRERCCLYTQMVADYNTQPSFT